MLNEKERFHEWIDSLAQFDLPDWEDLPQLDLYMDQVILLLTRYLSLINRCAEEKPITASIINNYVRMRVMPPPVKKKYSRSHLAYLVVICTLKQSLSISSIRRLLPENRSEEAVYSFYTAFVRRYRAAVAALRRMPSGGGLLSEEDGPFPEAGGGAAITAAIFAALTKSLTEFLLQPDGTEES